LLLVNYRPEYQHAWGGKTYYRQLRVDPLPPESADELPEALLGPDVALGPLKHLLVERTDANPLFLEESVRPTPSASPMTSRRPAASRTLNGTTARPWHSPTSWACARWPPIATSASGSSTDARATQ
jgi:hypothetical protein